MGVTKLGSYGTDSSVYTAHENSSGKLNHQKRSRVTRSKLRDAGTYRTTTKQARSMLRQKNTLLAALILCLSTAMVLGNFPLLQTSLNSDAFGQVRDDEDLDDDDDDDEEEDDLGTNAAGVLINAQGVLSLKKSTDKSKSLWRARQKQANARLKTDTASTSKLRKVSLTRLERMIAEQLKSGQPLSEEMLYLAGLTKIQYIFAYPETGDVVIAGPAEPIMLDDLGRPRGAKSGRAMLELQDLVVALRAFGPDGSKTNHIGVSIDPTKEGLARMQKFLSNVGRNINRGQTKNIVRGLTKSLGQQVVTVRGISPKTHYAQVLVEADYRMKLIGIGLETPPVDITTYVEKANPGSLSRNALARWYFVPNYESVRMSEDGLAAELVGEGVKLIGANEMVQQDGTRVGSKGGDRASKVFTQSFTKLYSKLALRSPVYAQLRNVIDLTIAAAAIQQNDMYGQTDWQMELFADEAQFPVEVFEAPKTVATAVNAIWRGNQLMTPVGGGVSIRPMEALSSENLLEDDGSVQQTRDTVSLNKLPESAWWWD